MIMISGEAGMFCESLCGTYSVCRNSRLEIGDGCVGDNLFADLVDSRVTIGADCAIARLEIYARGSTIHVGDETGFNGHVRLISPEPSSIVIGRDCMIGAVLITSSDMHSIIDVKSRARLNAPRPVEIGDHVWLGRNTYVMKGVRVGRGSIVGVASVVTRSIPEEALAVGSPARVVRHGVTWTSELGSVYG
jgi:acetyltransferase-like isoleucine patch superfamily enzyme